MIVGNGDHRYRVNADWAKLPDGWSFKEVGGVGVDSEDNVYVFNRGEHPMMIFDRDGNFLRSWGEGQYPRAHGVHVAPDDTMFLTDDGGHFVRKVTLGGKVILELGVPGKPAPFMSGEPFHRCTHTALSPHGEIYVSDGYGNSQVHKYTPDGKLLLSWGEPVPAKANSISFITSAATPTAGSMSPTARTTASRCSTATAGSRHSGRTCTVRADSACRMGTNRSFTSARSARPQRSAVISPTLDRASALSIIKAS